MGFVIQDVRAGASDVVRVQYAQAPAPAAGAPALACDAFQPTPNLDGIRQAQVCARQLQAPAAGRLYTRELAALDSLIYRASRGYAEAHADIVAIYSRHYALQGPVASYAADAKRQRDYTTRLSTYVEGLMGRNQQFYASGQNAQIAFARAVRESLAGQRADAPGRTSANVRDWLAHAPPELLQSFGTDPRLVPWLAALQSNQSYAALPAVRSAWVNLAFGVSVSENFGETYRATLAAMPESLRRSFSNDVRLHLNRQLTNAGTAEMRERFPNGEANIRARLAAMQ